MLVALLLSLGLIAWSLVANLVIGEHLYIARNLLLATALAGLGRILGSGWRDLGLGRAELGSGLRWGRNAALLVLVVVVLGIVLRDVVPVVDALLGDRRADLDAGSLAWASLVRIPLGTALFEEIAFRGVLLAALLHVTTVPWAVATSSLVFGLWHIAPTIVALRLNDVAPGSMAGIRAVVAAVLVTTVAGVLFAALRLVSGSLVAPILAHWATNGVGLLAAAAAGDPVRE